MSDVELLAELNAKYASMSVGPRRVVAEFADDGHVDELWPFEEFRKKLIKLGKALVTDPVSGRLRPIPVADWWLEHPDGRAYDRLVYAPPGSPIVVGSKDYNGWIPLAPPVPGDWSRNREHIRRIICGGDEDVFKRVMNWCAALVQWPGKHAHTALVLRGLPGVGKGHFADKLLGHMFNHHHYLHIMGAGQLTGQFNEHLSGKCYVFADESTYGGDPKAADKLKGLVSEDTVFIERKFLKGVAETSMLHIIIASNNEWPVQIPAWERRYTMLDVSDEKRQNYKYFDGLNAELENGGLDAARFDLLAWKVDKEATHSPITTKAKIEVSIRGLKMIEQWWFQKLQRGNLSASSNGHAPWPAEILKMTLHQDYIDFVSKHEGSYRSQRSTEIQLGQFLKKYADTQSERSVLVPGKDRQRTFKVRQLDVCRQQWLEMMGWPRAYDWDEDQ